MRGKIDRRSFIGKMTAAAAGAGLLKSSRAGRILGNGSELNKSTTTEFKVEQPSPNREDFSNGIITGKYIIPPNTPEWSGHAVFYQVYPQSFFDSDGDGIGDLHGIIRKLDYIKSLGADAVWINPFFQSPFHDGGYDISDYYKIGRRYGTNADARKLFKEAESRGLRILFDYVASYTSMDHPWFKDSAKQEKNNHSNWYIWADNVWMNPPRQFANSFVKGYGRRNGQYMLNFYYSEPALNYGFAAPDPDQKWELPVNHPDVMAMSKEMKKVFRFWMDMGAKGFRADMAGALVKASGLEGDKSVETSGQFYTTQEKGTKEFRREIRAIMNERYPDAFMVSEWSYPLAALDGCFHADFFHWFEGYDDLFQKESWRILNGYSEGHSYFDKEGKGDITFFLNNYLKQYEPTRDKGYISVPLGNHDNARLCNKRSDDDMEVIFAFGLTMPGVPFIYYGNEIGMRQMPESWPQVEGAYRPRNGARTPMQWNRKRNLGFSPAPAGKLYLPVNPSQEAPVVSEQEREPNSLLNRVRRLIARKHSEPALAAYAEFVPLYAKKDSYPFIYARAKNHDVPLVILNPAGSKAPAEFDVNVQFSTLKLLAGKEVTIHKTGMTVSVDVVGQSYAIYKLV